MIILKLLQRFIKYADSQIIVLENIRRSRRQSISAFGDKLAPQNEQNHKLVNRYT